MILYQAYAFVLPAFSPEERKVALPLMLMVPVLFVGGVAFAYFVVLHRRSKFLQNFNADTFDILVQAKRLLPFVVLSSLALGLLFQIPVGVLAVTRLGIFTPAQLRKNRGYVCSASRCSPPLRCPTPDPVTMLLAMVPLIVLYEAEYPAGRWLDRIAHRARWWGEPEDDGRRDPPTARPGPKDSSDAV